MTTFKPNEAEMVELKTAAEALKAANEALADAGKTVEAAKAKLGKWLEDNRSLKIETMKVGELVQIDGVVLIERAKQNKFDVKAFEMAQPKMYLGFKRDFPMTKFKPLV